MLLLPNSEEDTAKHTCSARPNHTYLRVRNHHNVTIKTEKKKKTIKTDPKTSVSSVDPKASCTTNDTLLWGIVGAQMCNAVFISRVIRTAIEIDRQVLGTNSVTPQRPARTLGCAMSSMFWEPCESQPAHSIHPPRPKRHRTQLISKPLKLFWDFF